MIYESSCSALINAVMKDLNFHNSGSNLESVHASFLKVALHHSNFSNKVPNSDIEKRILMAASDGNFISEIFLNWCF